ncbi:unnamed protein product [Rotaria sordida]|uniref:Uncharacterized protein n=1 Tax=Rotaria sordida TaxID=392033 RepID=A0A814ZC81_9BILA|nr:unnamed protein product [Rotaria sordida]CAF1254815.1 unnamed protein product [Rotaria sordida]CAF3666858.1 unnamed protein product [Rotaria sordida]CAF3839464.1 unnamed protein product [Rotaria sordida]
MIKKYFFITLTELIISTLLSRSVIFVSAKMNNLCIRDIKLTETYEILLTKAAYDVFLTNDQDNIVAKSTFDDSSMKSKVLRASYRGKANAMDRQIYKKPITLRSLSTSATYNNTKQPSTKYFITNTDDKISTTITTTNRSVNYSLDSVLNFTLELEKRSTDDIQRRHTISTNDIDPLLLNGLTEEENQLNLIGKKNK